MGDDITRANAFYGSASTSITNQVFSRQFGLVTLLTVEGLSEGKN